MSQKPSINTGLKKIFLGKTNEGVRNGDKQKENDHHLRKRVYYVKT